MKKDKKKVYYISDIAKAQVDYEDKTIDYISEIVEIGFLSVLTASTIALPLLFKFNPDLADVDKFKAALFGLGVPAVSIPIMVSKIRNAIRINKYRKAEAKWIKNNRGDITDKEIEEYIEEDGIHKLVRNMEK